MLARRVLDLASYAYADYAGDVVGGPGSFAAIVARPPPASPPTRSRSIRFSRQDGEERLLFDQLAARLRRPLLGPSRKHSSAPSPGWRWSTTVPPPRPARLAWGAVALQVHIAAREALARRSSDPPA
jgi:hypothetical protein